MNGILLHDAKQDSKQATALASPLFLPERILARTHFGQNPRFTGVVNQLGGSPIAGNEVVPAFAVHDPDDQPQPVTPAAFPEEMKSGFCTLRYLQGIGV